MKKNLNLELHLFTPSIASNHRTSMEKEAHDQQQQHRPLTIVYDGKVCVSDATENQAKSILMLANKEMEERVRTPTGSLSEPSSPAVFTNLIVEEIEGIEVLESHLGLTSNSSSANRTTKDCGRN
ncbi:unnamed protein product [Lathyrus oleraceus]